jgi:hypothetical protein
MELDKELEIQERNYNNTWNDYASMHDTMYTYAPEHSFHSEPDYTDYAHSDTNLCENCDHPFKSTPAGRKFCKCSR